MADRDDVRVSWKRSCGQLFLGFVVAVALSFSGCTQSAPKDAVNRGQVIDVDTGKPIPGAIVVGKYSGSRGFEGASSCNRVETAVSDENGWFDLPLDPNAGFLLMEAYQRGYRHGWPIRVPTCGINGDPNQCQIWQNIRDESDQVVSIIKEPTIYHGEAEATKVSRYWQDVYLKPSHAGREERLHELSRLLAANFCLAKPKTSAGLEPFLSAILEEQVVLKDSEGSLRITREQLEVVKKGRQVKK
jgi:hypothetical protein